MAINFPNNPAVNDTFTVGGTTFTFTGVKWETSAVVELSSDTTPTLGGTLDAGTNNINNVGVITATSFSGNLTGTATNAQGLTGDPSIQVTNATVLGNLDVQGTTTTIDTAVTEVDSLNVEGNVGIGTDNPGYKLELHGLTQANNLKIGTRVTNSDYGIAFGYFDELAGKHGFGIDRKHGGTLTTNEFVLRSDTGNVGVGTDTPGAKLEVHSDTIPRINAVWQGSKHFGMSVGGSGGGFVLTDGHFMTVNHQPYADRGTDNNLTERLRITSGGTIFSYSPNDTTPNFKFRSDDTNWHGALNQSVHGGTITSFLSCGGDWDANGTTYNCTKNLAAYPSSAIAVHNQYNSSFESKFVFLTKAGGSTTTDGGVTELASISSAGVISDSKGDLRKIPFKQESSAYTLVLADSGKAIEVQGDVTVPNNVFNSGDTITIINDSSSNKTISKGTGLQYMFNTADGTNANRTLGGRGMATIYFVNATTCYISGSQLT